MEKGVKQAKGIKSPVMVMSTKEHTGLWSSSTAHLKLTEHSKLIIPHQKKFFLQKSERDGDIGFHICPQGLLKPTGKTAGGGTGVQEQVSEEQEKDDPEVANKTRQQNTHKEKDILIF